MARDRVPMPWEEPPPAMRQREDYTDVGTVDAEDVRPTLRAVPAATLLDAAAPVEILEGLLEADGLTVLAAESGAGKTFLALDLAGAIAHGVWWHGRAITHGTVVYVSYEGTLSRRLRALAHHAQRRLEHLYILQAREPLSPRVTREGEIGAVGEAEVRDALEALARELDAAGELPIVAVIVDTVRASLTGSEDSSEHVSAYLRAVRRCMAVTPGAGWLLVHHAGWQDGEAAKKRERGSSAWRGNCDITLYLEAGEYDRETRTCPLTLTWRKTRDGETPLPLRLIRRRVDLLESDRHGQPVTSCIIERDPRTTHDLEQQRQQAQEAADRATDVALLRVIYEHPEATSLETLTAHMGLRRQSVSQARSRLIRRGWIDAFMPHAGDPYVITDQGATALFGQAPNS